MKFFKISINKTKSIFFILIVLNTVILSTACSQDSDNNRGEDEYVTLTFSKNVTGEVNSPIVNEILYYDSSAEKLNKVFESEYTSQYPLGFYDKKNKRVYYTKNIDIENDLSGDQIFLTDLNNNEEIQLTDSLFAVNNMYALDDSLFFVARPLGSNVLKLGLLDINTGEILYWGNEDTIEDINIEVITVDRKNERIYISAYSDSERRYNVLHQDGPPGQNNFKMPLHTVYETDFSFENTRKLFSEHEWIRTLMTKENYVIALSDKQYNDAETPSNLIQYNLLDNSLKKNKWNSSRLQVGDANYSLDEENIYAITMVNNKRGMYLYNIKSKKFTEIYAPKTGFLNNIQVVK
ncbi:hypothetical protein I6G82_08945 [Lysinibacillus macroides]|uniref:hypothetical protein n=1 Tax=Lysinibacillus macroides TaxID=33935 RepID=UPI0006B4B7D0|nr:hypothetical protein [Lysinibacillus macroides]QPR69690.1 hypothetical protein I6G82_08945 [Lysinibacillus macroides]